MRGLVLAMAFLLLPALAWAQDAPAGKASCAAMDQNLPGDLSAWIRPAPLGAAPDTAGLARAALSLGKAVVADLPSTSEVRYVAKPERPGGAASHGGLLDLKIDQAGDYVIALGSAAWIDVVKDGKPLTSTAHDHGPACSTIRKWVEFKLEPGRYVIQLSGAPEAKTVVLANRRS